MAKQSFTRRSFARSLLWMGLPALAMGVFLLFMAERLVPAPAFSRATLSIETADGRTIPFSVELATTPKQKAHGLMFRRSLPEGNGMLFIWDRDQMISMWMKNTYVPLDMLFLRKDGVITKIVTYTTPHDLTLISSDQPVLAVVELKAGEVDRRGIKTGDKVLYPAFSAGS